MKARTAMRCDKHPRYKAIYRPRCACDRCWDMWLSAERKAKRDLLDKEFTKRQGYEQH